MGQLKGRSEWYITRFESFGFKERLHIELRIRRLNHLTKPFQSFLAILTLVTKVEENAAKKETKQ